MSDFRILLIDQDASTTNYLSLEFKKIGFDVFSANSLKEGLILAYQQRPHVTILDPPINNENLRDLISKFQKDRRISRCRLIAFSSLTSPQDIQTALSLGFHYFMNKEGGAVPVLIRKALEAAELARGGSNLSEETVVPEEIITIPKEDPKLTTGKSIVFLSGKGGIGTSSLCANIANIANINYENNTTLVDLVLPIGSLATIVGLDNSIDVVQASKLDNPEDLIAYLDHNLVKPSNWNFRLLAGSNSPSQSEQLDISQIFIIMDAIRKISDYVFIDLGKTLSRISLPIIKSADQIVLTLSLDQTTVEHTKSVWNFLKEQGIEQNQIYFLINRAVGLEGLAKSQVEEILGSVIQLAIPYMGSNFTLANNLHQPVADKFPQDSVSISLRQASDEILRRIDQRTTKMDFFN